MVKRVIQFVNEINQNKYVTQNFDNYQRVMSKDLLYGKCIFSYFNDVYGENKKQRLSYTKSNSTL
jgi:hypothetical protein